MSGNHIDLKFVVVGDGAVGKTCLLQAFSNGEVAVDHVPTIFENSQKEYTYGKTNQKYNLDLWDTAGQENFDRLRPLSYKGVDCFLLCFDVSNATSLDNVRFKWIDEVNTAIKDSDDDAKGKLMLVGTKCDMRGKKSEKTKDLKEVTNEQIREQREQIGRLINESNWEEKVPYVETSAYERIKIDEVFQAAITLCMDTSPAKTKGCCTIL